MPHFRSFKTGTAIRIACAIGVAPKSAACLFKKFFDFDTDVLTNIQIPLPLRINTDILSLIFQSERIVRLIQNVAVRRLLFYTVIFSKIQRLGNCDPVFLVVSCATLSPA